MYTLRLIPVLLAFLLLQPVSSLAITIDEFEGDQSVEAGQFETDFNVITVPLAAGGLRSTAIGGTREFAVNGITGSTFLKTRLTTGLGFLSHSQDSGASGVSRITWDGDTVTGPINYTGLGGIDFTQDSSSALRVEVLRFDSPAGQSVEFEIILYSSSTAASSVRYTLTTEITSLTEIDIPFTDLSRHIGANSDVDLTSVGAVQLIIYGLNEDIDLRLEWFGTDECRYVPDNNLKVVDECGVCNGDNSTCADCLGVPNGNAVPGTPCDNNELGVCDGGTFNQQCQCERNTQPGTELCDGLDNDCDGEIDEAFPMLGEECGVGSGLCEFKGEYICDDNQTGLKCDDAALLQQLVDDCEDSKGCDDVPGSGLVEDICGVCGGDGSSCSDCKGDPFGPATLDRCGVCNGDGQSCLSCSTHDQSGLLTELDGGAKRQEAHIRSVNKQLRACDGSKKIRLFVKRSNKKARKRQIANWLWVWSELPIEVNQCDNTQFCIAQSNKNAVDVYVKRSKGLRTLGRRSLKRLSKCEMKAGRFNAMERKNNKIHDDNVKLANTVPLVQNECS